MQIIKTNTARLLDAAKIKYKLIAYTVDESNLSAIQVADLLNENIHQVFKTLVLEGDKLGHFVCIIPGSKELNMKHTAKVSGNKRCNMILMKDLLNITGYVRGACSPIGMKRKFPTFIHSSCLDFEYIYISAGQRGLQIQISPNDLIEVTMAKVVDLIQ